MQVLFEPAEGQLDIAACAINWAVAKAGMRNLLVNKVSRELVLASEEWMRRNGLGWALGGSDGGQQDRLIAVQSWDHSTGREARR